MSDQWEDPSDNFELIGERQEVKGHALRRPTPTDDPDWEIDTSALAAEAEVGYDPATIKPVPTDDVAALVERKYGAGGLAVWRQLERLGPSALTQRVVREALTEHAPVENVGGLSEAQEAQHAR